MAEAIATETRSETRTLVHYEAQGGVALLTLDDPPANTYTYQMMRQLDEAILRARMDDDVHVIGTPAGFSCGPPSAVTWSRNVLTNHNSPSSGLLRGTITPSSRMDTHTVWNSIHLVK
jgi:hypothetical protein